MKSSVWSNSCDRKRLSRKNWKIKMICSRSSLTGRSRS